MAYRHGTVARKQFHTKHEDYFNLHFSACCRIQQHSSTSIPIIAAGTSIISLVRDLVAKQTAPALAAPSVGLTNKFSEWKPKLVAGQEVYSNKATEVLRDIYENIERLTKQTNKIASEVNRTDDIGKNNYWMILSLVLYSRWTSLPDHHKSFQQPEWKIGGRPG